MDELQQQEAEIRVAMEAAGNDKHKVNSHMMVAPSVTLSGLVSLVWVSPMLLMAVVAAMCGSCTALLAL